MCQHKKWTPNCYDCDNRFLRVKNYSHSRPVEFQGRPRNGLYIGLELEVECGCEKFQVLDALKGHIDDIWEFKADGSLNNGIEFESQPMGIAQWMQGKHLNWIKKLPRSCKSHDTTTCGLHLHVNRSQLSPDAVGKINYFINKYQSQFEKLGRRHWNKYCKVDSNYRNYNHRTYGYLDKYRAVNLSRDETIEFRFPKGTLYIPTIKATIALIYAVCEIVPKFSKQQLETEDCWALFVDAVINWPKKNMNYVSLANYLKKKGLA